ncbi:MAG: thermonuclease family protein [Pseudomonadota bacterium]
MQKKLLRIHLSALLLMAISLAVAKAESLHDMSRDLQRSATPIKVQKTTGPFSFIDDKGILYTLSELDTPESIAPDTAQALSNLTDKKNCTLYQTKNTQIGRINRMGEILGQFECGPDLVWLQEFLIGKGLARVRTTPDNHDLASTLLKMEHTARTRKLGLWSKPENNILTPDTAAQHINSFQIIEGTIYTVAQTHDIIYLNFSRDWKTDFTIGVPNKLLRAFSTAHINLQSLKGQPVRVRGWIREYNGAYIELDHIEQLEILSDNTHADYSHDVLPAQKSAEPSIGMHSIKTPIPPTVEKPKTPEIPPAISKN